MQSSFSPGEDAGQLSNLVYSCYHCNRHKSNFKINKLNSTLLNPDTRSINKVFIRTDDYDIQIQKHIEIMIQYKIFTKITF